MLKEKHFKLCYILKVTHLSYIGDGYKNKVEC